MTVPTSSLLDRYFQALHDLGRATACSDEEGQALSLPDALDRLRGLIRETSGQGNTALIIGNGGSAGIASHLAIDYAKNGNLRMMALNDAAALTCLANDLGYEQVFAKQVEMHGQKGDLLIAISSSGRSPNILKAVTAARAKGIGVATLSGFDADNPLRQMGDVNFFIASHLYGFVELLHTTLLHAALDFEMGWTG
jgi:D-sedoheptulose 7-phosphate isomerase